MDNELAIRRVTEYMKAIDEKYMAEIIGILHAYKEKSRNGR